MYFIKLSTSALPLAIPRIVSTPISNSIIFQFLYKWKPYIAIHDVLDRNAKYAPEIMPTLQSLQRLCTVRLSFFADFIWMHHQAN